MNEYVFNFQVPRFDGGKHRRRVECPWHVFWCTWRSIYGDSARTSSAGTVQRTFEMTRTANVPTKTFVLSVLDASQMCLFWCGIELLFYAGGRRLARVCPWDKPCRFRHDRRWTVMSHGP